MSLFGSDAIGSIPSSSQRSRAGHRDSLLAAKSGSQVNSLDPVHRSRTSPPYPRPLPERASSLTRSRAGCEAGSAMSEHVYADKLRDHVGQEVTLKGWLYAKRSSGKLLLLELRDGTGIAPCVVFKPEVPEELFERAKHLPQETSLIVHGTVRAHARKADEVEVGIRTLEVIAQPSSEYPIGPKDHGIDFLMDHRHLWL